MSFVLHSTGQSNTILLMVQGNKPGTNHSQTGSCYFRTHHFHSILTHLFPYCTGLLSDDVGSMH